MADAAGRGRDVRSGGNAAGGACGGGDVLTRAILWTDVASFWQTSKAPEDRALARRLNINPAGRVPTKPVEPEPPISAYQRIAMEGEAR